MNVLTIFNSRRLAYLIVIVNTTERRFTSEPGVKIKLLLLSLLLI